MLFTRETIACASPASDGFDVVPVILTSMVSMTVWPAVRGGHSIGIVVIAAGGALPADFQR